MHARCSRGSKPTRRRVLQAGLGWAALPAITRAGRAGHASAEPDRTLVLLHLSGGNDGLNTVIPHADPLYYELRPRLSRPARDVLAIDARVGFHPSLSALVPLFDRGHLAIVQGVGYPDPDYSHVGSCRIWATARRAGLSSSRVHVVSEGAEVTSHLLDPAACCPGRIGRTLATIARLVTSSHPPELVLATAGGFDTHTDQLERHARVLCELGDGLAAFQQELEERGVAGRVLLMAWSEFGRRPAENAMQGTDHGSAGPVFVLGRKVRGGIYGQMPSLQDTDFGNLIPTVDFRAVYATLAECWLNRSTDRGLGPHESLRFL